MKRDDDIVGMTLMLQSHAPSSISSFEEKQLRNLCFIIYDPAECMNDVIHSYLRSLAQIRSQRDHVFIVDRDGGVRLFFVYDSHSGGFVNSNILFLGFR